MSANLGRSTVIKLKGKWHILFIDLTYASRIQMTPRKKTIRLIKHKVRGKWERADESQIPPVQDWQHYGKAYEDRYGCMLWQASFKGLYILNALFDRTRCAYHSFLSLSDQRSAKA